MTLAERFWTQVQRGDGCWLWTGRRHVKGYGRILVDGVLRMAHRIAYELHHGTAVPEELTIDHLCGTKACVNPDHFEVVSRGENARRYMMARPGCVHGHSWTPKNTRIDKKGRRRCRACGLARYYASKESSNAVP